MSRFDFMSISVESLQKSKAQWQQVTTWVANAANGSNYLLSQRPISHQILLKDWDSIRLRNLAAMLGENHRHLGRANACNLYQLVDSFGLSDESCKFFDAQVFFHGTAGPMSKSHATHSITKFRRVRNAKFWLEVLTAQDIDIQWNTRSEDRLARLRCMDWLDGLMHTSRHRAIARLDVGESHDPKVPASAVSVRLSKY